VVSGLPGRISEDILAEVKRSADIVDIISRYVTVKKAGRSFKALCPFHTEKTPSFIVNPERQLFRCFGCGKAGDVFSFVAEHERVDFPEAVRIVASAVGISIPDNWGRKGAVPTELKTRLYELHTWATRFFAGQLAEAPGGEKAREYLAKRHFDKAILEDWGVGYAADSWDALLKAAQSAGYTEKELATSGLVVRREGGEGCYDRFRNRVVFPIRDVQGRAIAFGARTLGEDEVKYINSPETPLFSKGRCLYGLDKARNAVISGRRVMITEGYTDTLMCHQMGIPWAVATLGTALTRDHVALLRRYADTVVLLFDADKAGEAAADRSVEVFAGEGDEAVPGVRHDGAIDQNLAAVFDASLEVKVATTDAGSDPCDFLLSHGPEEFVRRVEAARDLFEVKLDLTCRKHNMASSDGRARAVDEALRVIAQIGNTAKADLLTEAIAKRVGADRDAVRRRLGALRKPARKTAGKPAGTKAPEMDPVERGVLCSVLARGELVPCVLSRASLEDFQDTRVRRILEECVALYDREGEIDPAMLSAALQDGELAALVAQFSLSSQAGGNWEGMLQDCLDRLGARKQEAGYQRLKERAAGVDAAALAAIQEHHRRRAGRATDGAAK
jgi:DNA primase